MLSKLKDFKSKHPLISGIIIMITVTFFVLLIIMQFLKIWTHHGDDVKVPEIKQLSFNEARNRLADADLEIAIADSIYDTSVAPGTVVEVVPKAGCQVKRGREIYVTITAFSPKNVTISMPITGVSARQAASYLNALGIHAIRYVQVPSDYPDLVESAQANGRPIGSGSIIPVNASVVLGVGVAKTPTEELPSDITDENADESVSDYNPEPADYSTYEDQE